MNNKLRAAHTKCPKSDDCAKQTYSTVPMVRASKEHSNYSLVLVIFLRIGLPLFSTHAATDLHGQEWHNNYITLFRLGKTAPEDYRIAGNFRGSKYSWFSSIVSLWLLLALQVKVGKVASFVGKMFAVKCSTTNILTRENYPLSIF